MTRHQRAQVVEADAECQRLRIQLLHATAYMLGFSRRGSLTTHDRADLRAEAQRIREENGLVTP